MSGLILGCGDDEKESQNVVRPAAQEWRTFGGSLERTSYNSSESQITKDTIKQLVPRWRFLTGAVVSAAPIVADITRPGERNPVKTLFLPSWDGFFYALNANSGDLLWSYRFKTQPGAEFVQGSSATVEEIDGRNIVFIANGETMYAFDAATGGLIWEFDAGTGCTTCDRYDERNEILSAPAVFNGTIYFGMDINEIPSGKGGLYALDVRTGVLRWYFDLATGATCHPNPEDHLRRFDGFHSARRLGLTDDFFTSRPGCGFDRTPTGCSSVYGAIAVDRDRRRLYAASTNCNPPTQGSAMTSPYDEALFSLTLDGDPVWHWRPREVDSRDLDFGVGPNLFRTSVAGQMRDVVGIGGKDGTYYLLDRDGVNALSGRVEPYWQTNVVLGGPQGGIMATAAVAEGRILFSTGFGERQNGPFNFQRPAAWGLMAGTGSVLWSNRSAPASFSPAMAIPQLVFLGSFSGPLFAYDSETGESLGSFKTGSVGLYSQGVAVGGQLYVGSGTGARVDQPEDVAYQVSLFRSPITAFCVAGTEGCPQSGACIDPDPCSIDAMLADGCTHTQAPDGTACRVGAFVGTCQSGDCDIADLDCDDHNQCTHDVRTPKGCQYASAPDGTPCLIRGEIADTCHQGGCGTEPHEGSHPF